MEIEILTLADNAQNYQGKLVVVGTFNMINSLSFPFKYSFTLVCKFRLLKDEKIFENISIKLIDENEAIIAPEVTGKLTSEGGIDGNNPFKTIDFIVNFNQVEFAKEGVFRVMVNTDNGFHAELPLMVGLS
ncbi:MULTISPECIES: hypothetical protein [Bacteroides]|uniref:DUF6941 family protein n=1 Tax=Bacteroides TaxID=816 RepID=UPI00259D138D|nr:MULTISPECIES: hypothetical protein [Bacteroides]